MLSVCIVYLMCLSLHSPTIIIMKITVADFGHYIRIPVRRIPAS